MLKAPALKSSGLSQTSKIGLIEGVSYVLKYVKKVLEMQNLANVLFSIKKVYYAR